jgi:uncharacterized membrane protein
MTRLVSALLWVAAVGCGVIAGLYFAFSTFIITALDRAGPVPGTVAMNQRPVHRGAARADPVLRKRPE